MFDRLERLRCDIEGWRDYVQFWGLLGCNMIILKGDLRFLKWHDWSVDFGEKLGLVSWVFGL